MCAHASVPTTHLAARARWPIAFGQLAPAGRIHAARLMALLPLTHGDARVLRRRVCYSGAVRVRVRVRVSYSGAAAEGRGRDGRDGEAR